jgi:transcriptional regulator with XRE-family HTH domain
MSRNIFIESLTVLNSEYLRLPAMDTRRVERLADYVKRLRNEKRLSLNEVARLSGGQISNSYVSLIENGYILNVTPKKLRALARGLQVDVDEISAVAIGRSPQDPSLIERQLLGMFRELPQEQRDDFIEMLRGVHRKRAVKEVKNGSSPKTKRRDVA